MGEEATEKGISIYFRGAVFIITKLMICSHSDFQVQIYHFFKQYLHANVESVADVVTGTTIWWITQETRNNCKLISGYIQRHSPHASSCSAGVLSLS